MSAGNSLHWQLKRARNKPMVVITLAANGFVSSQGASFLI